MNRKRVTGNYRWLFAGTFFAMAVALGWLWLQPGHLAVGQDRTLPAADSGLAKAESLSRAFRGAAKQVLPTVVTIRATSRPKTIENSRSPGGSRENPFKGTPFEDFFRDFEDTPGFRMPNQMPRREGLGSGVIIDSQGVILTNNHVVEGADEVMVKLADGREVKATDIRTDKETDLAVLRIQVDESLPAARLGDSDALEIGDWVIAVGNPFELEQTVSAGIISGKGRSIAAGRRANFLQTDAAINPGNSGGPLVNLRGEVIGINTAIASRTGVYSGIGFAIPSNLARWVTKQLIDKGEVERAYLGVSITELNGRIAEQLGVDPRKGVLISEVFPDSPAAKAGFEAGDIILSFAGEPVSSPRELQALVERSQAGSEQRAEIVRSGKRQTLGVVVKPLPKDFGMAARPGGLTPKAPTHKSENLGLEVGELTAELAKKLGFEGFQGVVITEVEPNGVAAEAGLDEGMLILRVGQKSVTSIDEFEKAVKGASLKEGVLLLVRTSQGNRFVVLQGS
jgi:serine protease Do